MENPSADWQKRRQERFLCMAEMKEDGKISLKLLFVVCNGNKGQHFSLESVTTAIWVHIFWPSWCNAHPTSLTLLAWLIAIVYTPPWWFLENGLFYFVLELVLRVLEFILDSLLLCRIFSLLHPPLQSLTCGLYSFWIGSVLMPTFCVNR